MTKKKSCDDDGSQIPEGTMKVGDRRKIVGGRGLNRKCGL